MTKIDIKQPMLKALYEEAVAIQLRNPNSRDIAQNNIKDLCSIVRDLIELLDNDYYREKLNK
jgi:hypothetical protein